MKSIILSVKPQEAVNILNGKQTIIIKKTAPKETPFKVYLYCTKGKKGVIFKSRATNEIRLGFERDNSKEVIDILNKSGRQTLNGKVVAEFVCESVIYFDLGELDLHPLKERFLRKSKLTEKELKDYIGKGVGKVLHIADLKVYDKPKELWRFRKECAENANCTKCEFYKIVDGGYECSPVYDCTVDDKKPITKPPATWMYVEE